MASESEQAAARKELFGHPAGLFVLFFVELWERFSFYGMRALLVLYMTKALLFSDDMSYGIYAAYGSLVYATPVIGGFLADKLLGYRRSIMVGAVLMSLGHFAMTFDAEVLGHLLGPLGATTDGNVISLWGGSLNATIFFYGALALLIIGNGFFKPNISSLVGKLYDDDHVDEGKRDGGFTIFYMGINIGALMAGLICGTVGEVYGWHYGFGLAGVGMLAGLVIFVKFQQMIGDHGFAPDPERLDETFPPEMSRREGMVWAVYLGAAGLAIYVLGPVIATAIEAALAATVGSLLSVAGTGSYLTAMFYLLGGLGIELAILGYLFTFLSNKHATYLGALVAVPNIAYLVTRHDVMGGLLLLLGVGVLGWLFVYALQSEKVARERLFVVLVLTFFSMTFWAFFEQAGSSVNLFTDRSVDRVVPMLDMHYVLAQYPLLASIAAAGLVSAVVWGTMWGLSRMGEEASPTTEEPARSLPSVMVTSVLAALASLWTYRYFALPEGQAKGEGALIYNWEVPTTWFQSVNPFFILLLAPVFAWLWEQLKAIDWEPSTPVKFSLGLLQLALGFGAFVAGAALAGPDGKVAMIFLLLGYLLHTTGELCLSPVGLSMVTKLSPKAVVGAVMGAWFLSSSFAHYIAGLFAQIASAPEGSSMDEMTNTEMLTIYSELFGTIGIIAASIGLLCLLLAPVLKKWMHGVN